MRHNIALFIAFRRLFNTRFYYPIFAVAIPIREIGIRKPKREARGFQARCRD